MIYFFVFSAGILTGAVAAYFIAAMIAIAAHPRNWLQSSSPLRRVVIGAHCPRLVDSTSRCAPAARAMLARLRTLTQTRHGPDRYVLSTFFETDALSAKLTSARKDGGAIFGNVFVEQDAGFDAAE